MTITDLVAAFGSHYRPEGQSIRDLDASFFQPLVTEGFFGGLIPTVKTEERRVKSVIGQILRKKQKAFTGDDSAEFKPRLISLQELAYEYQAYPDEIQASYIGFLAQLDTNDRAAWPITRYIVDVLMIQKGREEFELNEVYKGTSEAIDPGVANSPGENFDGLEAQMNASVAAAGDDDIVPITAPASWDTDPEAFLVELETFIEDVKLTSNEARLLVEGGLIRKIAMAPELRDRLAKGVFKTYNMNYNATRQNIINQPIEVPLPFGNLIAVGLPSMSGKERIFMTPEINKACFIKKPMSETGPEVQKVDREVKIFMDFWKGIGFWHKEYVYMSDHEVPD
jgi:hypothetical protein